MAISKRREEENQLPRERVRFNSGIKSENESSTRCLNKKKKALRICFLNPRIIYSRRHQGLVDLHDVVGLAFFLFASSCDLLLCLDAQFS